MKRILLLVLTLSFWAHALTLPNEIAWYPLHEGEGEETREAFDRLPPAKISGSFWITRDGLNLIDFGGMKNSRQAQVDLPPLEFDGEFSMAIWVSAYWWNENWDAICARSDATYGIKNNQNRPGQIFFRVKDKNAKRGANLVSETVLDRLTWHHVVATFVPGKSMRIYIDGKLDAERTENVPQEIERDNETLHLGRTGRGNCFSGLFSNLHLYDRAITEEEVKAIYKNENSFGLPPLEEDMFAKDGAVAATLPGAEILEGGALVVHSGQATFSLNSSYAYPQEPNMGFNVLAPSAAKGCEASWQPVVKQGDKQVTVTATGSVLALQRLVSDLGDGRIRVQDTLTNLTEEDQAVVFSHYLMPQEPLAEWYLHGEEQSLSTSNNTACNPTGWFSTGDDALAWVVEDDIFRCHLEASVKERPTRHNICAFGSRKIGVPAGQKRVLEFTLYPMKGDYFDFLNRLRHDWQVPEVTIPGPFAGFRTAGQRSETYRRFAADPNAMKTFFQRRNTRVFNLSPCYNYWDGTLFPTRDEYKNHIQEAMRIIRASVPDAIFLAGLETIVYCLAEEDFSTPAPPDFSWKKVTPGTTKRVLESPWKDSATLRKNGSIDLYPDTPVEGKTRPSLYLIVHPLVGNTFFKQRLEDYAFLLDEVGLDGVYQDMFGYGGTFIHDRWDGFSISVLPNGRISSKFAHLGPLTAPAREIWLKDILRRGKIALTNFGAPTTRNLQTIPYMNFCEAAGNGIGRQNLDSIPPEASGVTMNQLSTPLGYGPHRTEEQNGPRLMSRVRAYLRHGALYIHTSVRNFFPSDGPKGGEYGPINHSYPITPVELHRGWVKGRERIVSCVSYKTTWDRQEQPVALRFDANGREIPVGDGAVITGKPGAWEIAVNIKDWLEFLIIE